MWHQRISRNFPQACAYSTAWPTCSPHVHIIKHKEAHLAVLNTYRLALMMSVPLLTPPSCRREVKSVNTEWQSFNISSVTIAVSKACFPLLISGNSNGQATGEKSKTYQPNGHSSVHCLCNCWQHVERGGRVIQLTSSVIAHNDAIASILHSLFSVSRRKYALQKEQDVLLRPARHIQRQPVFSCKFPGGILDRNRL